ncbi:hypothetical protein HC891_04820 [Candidatus Gracilibacteria bacterium]|nr:hypothetical protein [Candidatus Gracilibacteria bacterium]
MLRLGEHGVEERHLVAMLSRQRCRVERAERREGLHRRPEFAVEAQVVRLAEEDFVHYFSE